MNLQKTENNFNHPIFGSLTAIINESNDAFFISNEVSKILGYEENRDLLKRLDEDEKLLLNHAEAVVLFQHDGINSRGVQLLTESGLYSAILGSNKQEAKEFKKWVTSGVLPSIRKNGSYSVQKKQELPTTFLEALEKLVETEKKRIEAEKTVAILTHVNKTYTMTEIAKELNLKSAIELNKILKDKGVQYKMNGTWVLYSKYSNLGYFDIKQEVLDNGKVVYHRRVTQIGREFIIKLLSK